MSEAPYTSMREGTGAGTQIQGNQLPHTEDPHVQSSQGVPMPSKGMRAFTANVQDAWPTIEPVDSYILLNGTGAAPTRTAASTRSMSKRASLASSRIERDRLERVLNELILKETELTSAYELVEYTQRSCSAQHNEIRERLQQYEGVLRDTQQQTASLQASDGGVDSVLHTPQQRARWLDTQALVTTTLPALLSRLEERMSLHGAKISHIQDLLAQVQAQRHAVRNNIQAKEHDIALALATVE